MGAGEMLCSYAVVDRRHLELRNEVFFFVSGFVFQKNNNQISSVLYSDAVPASCSLSSQVTLSSHSYSVNSQ